MRARVAEVFKSIQGEGIYLGKDQVFIRFFGCNLSCGFCDTRLSFFKEYSAGELIQALRTYSGFHSLSLTGGEPLMQKDFLREFLPLVKAAGFKTYLETNATLATALPDVIEYIDIIAADFKLPSSTGLRDFWQEHEIFMRAALGKEVFVKAVICKSTHLADLQTGVKLLIKLKRNIPFILQPNSYEFDSELAGKVQECKRFAQGFLADVRIIPQMHKVAGIK